MKLWKAIGKLGKDEVLTLEGSDGSYFYQWGKDRCMDETLVDENGEKWLMEYYDLICEDWIVVDKKAARKALKRFK